jgi:hypothetical protein
MFKGGSRPARSAEEGSKKSAGFWPKIKNILVFFGVLFVVLAPVALIDAYAGHGSDTKEPPEGQPFATDPVELETGLAIVEMTHQGEGDFAVDLLPAEGEETTASSERAEFFGDPDGASGAKSALALAKEKTGSVDASRAVAIPTTGRYVFDVKATGPWTVRVEQPRPSEAPEPTRFSGDDDTATPLFQLSSGLKQINVTSPTGGKLEISLLRADGSEVGQVVRADAGKSEGYPPATFSSKVDIQEPGIYLFDVQADNLWTIDISDAE